MIFTLSNIFFKRECHGGYDGGNPHDFTVFLDKNRNRNCYAIFNLNFFFKCMCHGSYDSDPHDISCSRKKWGQGSVENLGKKCPNFIRTIGRHFDNLMKWLVRLGSIK